MSKKFLGFIVLVLIIAGVFFWQNFLPRAEVNLTGEKMEVYKTAYCGCCGVYAKYLSRNGVETEVKNISDAELEKMKTEYGITQDLSSCHTSFIGGYAVEGHIPLEVVEKLFDEKPDIKGIALPGMPSGSPGMPGPKMGEWVIYSIGNDGNISEFTRI